ncbi:hypothetical protein RJ639_020272 [Escallonia herrerae]|uniref:Uncharacterized protein n=1 Tax=Escallonia herrerae TaxID=1293975 RepID=A0AA89AGW1_9ASTE|nr:hypothetical protein RJ639_020272 [Escallonia herrerae]
MLPLSLQFSSSLLVSIVLKYSNEYSLEWWSFEIVILLSGLLPNPQLETSVLSICLTVAALHYFIPFAFGSAASTRISNELGAGNPEAARDAIWAVMVFAVIEVIIASTTLLCCRFVLGYAFGNEKEVVGYVKGMTPLICFLMVMDTLQARKRMAAYRGLSQSWGTLSGWDPYGSSIGREGPLDWTIDRINGASFDALSHNKFNKLAKTGNKGKGKDI